MTLPELVRRSMEKTLEQYCRERSSACPCGGPRLQYLVRDCAVTLVEEEGCAGGGGAGEGRPIAQLRFNAELAQWTLHYPDPSGNWCFYLNASPSLNLEKLLRHLDEDPLHTFRE